MASAPGGPEKESDLPAEGYGYFSTGGGQTKQATDQGLSYENHIPRPTKKGYYKPKVVPYPVGKPVHVNGYYRRSGNYVQTHFRSLPRR